jgi:hypothetical protein
VLSKGLYNEIRERFLPYQDNLFYFALKLFFVIVFSYITLTLVNILQASDVSPAVQLLTTLSVGALPHLMNIVVAQKGEEEKNAWKKNLRTRVKPEVIKLAKKNPLFLIIHSAKQPPTVESSDGSNNERSGLSEEEIRRLEVTSPLLPNNEAEESTHSINNFPPAHETSV